MIVKKVQQWKLWRKMASWRRDIAALGLCFWFYNMLQHNLSRLGGAGREFRVVSPLASFPMWYRKNTSDLSVFDQIFISREYRCLDDVSSAALIVDCGGNVGYSSAYFLTRYPSAKVIAIEPEASNFMLLQKNLEAYGDRVICIHSGLWSHSTGLKISEKPFGDGRQWAVSVRESRPGEAADMQAVDIAGILAESGYPRITILKIDIEGSEAEVFAHNYKGWLDKVDNLVIELHDERCAEVFHAAIAGAGFAVSECDELTVCRRPAEGETR